MKRLLLLLGLLAGVSLVVGCSVSVYTDEFNDNVVDYVYWINSTNDVVFTEANDKMWVRVNRVAGARKGFYYIPNVANSDFGGFVNLTRMAVSYPGVNLSAGTGWGIRCRGVGTETEACVPYPNHPDSECNNYAEQNNAVVGNDEWRVQIRGGVVNFTWGDIFIQCNNTWNGTYDDISLEFNQHAVSGGGGYTHFEDWVHENLTAYHELIWLARDCVNGGYLSGVNITITNSVNSPLPVPVSCVTGADGKCVFLFDYDCGLGCEDVIFIDAVVSDTGGRFADVEYENIGIGRDEYGAHTLSPCYTLSITSHWIDFHVTDIAQNIMVNASCQIMEDDDAHTIHTCYTNLDGNCSILMVNGHYVIRVDSEDFLSYMVSEELILTSSMGFHIPKRIYMIPIYSTDVNLSLIVSNGTTLSDKEPFTGLIQLEYIGGNPDYLGFSWKVSVVNGTGNIFGIPRGDYALTVHNLTDYSFMVYNLFPPPQVLYQAILIDSFNDVVENRYYAVSYYSGLVSFSGTVYGCADWNCVYLNNFVPLANVSLYLESPAHIYSVDSDASGDYSFTGVAVGPYVLSAFPLNLTYAPDVGLNLVLQSDVLGYNLYLHPHGSYPEYNMSIYGHVMCNNSYMGGIEVSIAHGYRMGTVTDSNGFYNLSREAPLPATFSVWVNPGKDYGCVFFSTYQYIGSDNPHVELNVSLGEITYKWEVSGEFMLNMGGRIEMDYVLYRNNLSGEVIAEGQGLAFIIGNIPSGDYIMRVSRVGVQTAVFPFTLPNDLDMWGTLGGVWDLESLEVFGYYEFRDITFYVIDTEGQPLPNVRVAFTPGYDTAYIGNTDSPDGKITFEGVPCADYILSLTKEDYVFANTALYLDLNSPNSYTFVMGGTRGAFDAAFSMDDVVTFVGFIGIPAVLLLFCVFIYSAIRKGLKNDKR